MRLKIASADSFLEAAEVRSQLVEEFPDKTFQIRRHRNSFVIVERVIVNAAKGKKRGNSV